MFNSLKKKIREETGTDPTKAISNIFKGRTTSVSDLIESKDNVTSSEFLDEHHVDSMGNRSVPVSPSNLGTVKTDVSFGSPSVSKQDLKQSGYKESGNVGAEVTASTDGCSDEDRVCVDLGSGRESQGQNGLITRPTQETNNDKDKDVVQQNRLCDMTYDPVEVSEKNSILHRGAFVVGVQDDQELERNKYVDSSIVMQLRKTEEQLRNARTQLEVSNERCSHLSATLLDEKNVNAQLNLKVSLLQDDIHEQSVRLGKMGETLQRELRDKDVMLLRNAQLNQDVEMARQELRLQEGESSELHAKLAALTETMMEKDKELQKQRVENEELCRRVKELLTTDRVEDAAFKVEQELRRNVAALEEQLAEKVKSIRVLQQHSNDLKKTLQRELKQSVDEPPGDATGAASSSPSAGQTDVNFKYLKHVIMKFLTSREYEAQHLTRAVSTLLHFSPEEERLLRETLDWKMSWFGTRPQLGFGQTSKTIPPS